MTDPTPPPPPSDPSPGGRRDLGPPSSGVGGGAPEEQRVPATPGPPSAPFSPRPGVPAAGYDPANYIPTGYGPPPAYGAPGQYPYYVPPTSRLPTWAKALLGGCGGCLVLSVIAILIAGAMVGKLGATVVPLADFPRYPHATVSGAAISSQTGTTLTLTTSDPVDAVATYYRAALNGATWTTDNYDSETNIFRFHRAGDRTGRGTITLNRARSMTIITIAYQA